MIKKTIFAVILIFISLQFINNDRTKHKINKEISLHSYKDISSDVLSILKRSCYDCHSYETTYDTTISNIAPFSFVATSHVNDGRKALNFSKYQQISSEIKKARLKRAITTINNGRMPLSSYTTFHPNAKLTKDEKLILEKWFKSELKKYEDIK